MTKQPHIPLTPAKAGAHHPQERRRKVVADFLRGYIKRWIPAFAGMSGVLIISCQEVQSYENSTSIENSNQAITLMKSDVNDADLIKGMKRIKAIKNIQSMGWQVSMRKSLGGDTTYLWATDPCAAAAFERSQTFFKVSTDRPPKYYQLNADFYECEDGDAKRIGQLSKIAIKEIEYVEYAKNQ